MGSIKLPHASGNSMSIAAPATNPASDLELKLPATVGTANQYLKNSGTPGTLEFGSVSVTTSTDQYVCKAWCNLSGDSSPPSIRDSYNINTITDNGSGDYTFNFITAMGNANYSVSTSGSNGDNFCFSGVHDSNMTTGSVRCCFRTARTSGKTDFPLVLIAVWGDS